MTKFCDRAVTLECVPDHSLYLPFQVFSNPIVSAAECHTRLPPRHRHRQQHLHLQTKRCSLVPVHIPLHLLPHDSRTRRVIKRTALLGKHIFTRFQFCHVLFPPRGASLISTWKGQENVVEKCSCDHRDTFFLWRTQTYKISLTAIFYILYL